MYMHVDELKESGPEFPSISESTCTGADDSLMESCDDRATNLDSRSFTSSSSGITTLWSYKENNYFLLHWFVWLWPKLLQPYH